MRKLLLFFVFFLVPCFACTQGALGGDCATDTSGECTKSAGKCLQWGKGFQMCNNECKGDMRFGTDRSIVFDGITYPEGGYFSCDGSKWNGIKGKSNFNLSKGMMVERVKVLYGDIIFVRDGNDVFVTSSLYSGFNIAPNQLQYGKKYTMKDLYGVTVKEKGGSFSGKDVVMISEVTGYSVPQVLNDILSNKGTIRNDGVLDSYGKFYSNQFGEYFVFKDRTVVGDIRDDHLIEMGWSRLVDLPTGNTANRNNNQNKGGKSKKNKKNGCTPDVLAGMNAAKGEETKDGGCVAKECNPGYYFVYKNGVYQGWCVGSGHCPKGKKLKVFDGNKTDMTCIDASNTEVKEPKPVEGASVVPKENVAAQKENNNIDAVSKDELNNLIDNLKKELENSNLQDKQKVEGLIKQLDNIRKSLDGKVDNRQVQEAIQTALDGFAASVHNSSDSRLGEMYNDVVRRINDYVVPVENRLMDLEGGVAGLYGVTTDQGVAISGLGIRIDGVKADVDGLYGKNAELVNSLYSLQGLTDAQKKQIANLSEMLKVQDKKVADVVQLVLGTAETLSDAQKKEVLRLIEEYVAGQNYMQRDAVENLIKQFMKEHMDSVNKIREQEVVRDKINSAMSVLNSFAASAKVSVWKDKDGNFNTARLASDSVAGVVLGTAGGLISNHLIKKSQVKNGMEDIRCTVGGQVVAEYGDEFMVGMQ